MLTYRVGVAHLQHGRACTTHRGALAVHSRIVLSSDPVARIDPSSLTARQLIAAERASGGAALRQITLAVDRGRVVFQLVQIVRSVVAGSVVFKILHLRLVRAHRLPAFAENEST